MSDRLHAYEIQCIQQNELVRRGLPRHSNRNTRIPRCLATLAQHVLLIDEGSVFLLEPGFGTSRAWTRFTCLKEWQAGIVIARNHEGGPCVMSCSWA